MGVGTVFTTKGSYEPHLRHRLSLLTSPIKLQAGPERPAWIRSLTREPGSPPGAI
jgi:hypothetical protein